MPHTNISTLLALLVALSTGLAKASVADESPPQLLPCSRAIAAPEQAWSPPPAAKPLANLDVGPPRTVRLIYFLPKGRRLRAEVINKMKKTARQVQTFYAEQMQAHGYGDRAFRLETDAAGGLKVHRVEGQHPDSYYRKNTSSTVQKELRQAFDLTRNIYIIAIDNSMVGITAGLWGRLVGGIGIHNDKAGGVALFDERIGFGTMAHELGHTFGLSHDFRDDAYIMSYGRDERLSACNAGILAVHPYFNDAVPNYTNWNQRPTIDLLSPWYPAGASSVSVQLSVRDPAGLHQVTLFVRTRKPHFSAGFREVKACRGLGGEQETVVEFDYDGVIPSAAPLTTSLSRSIVHGIEVGAVDRDGDELLDHFILAEMSPYHIATLEGQDRGRSFGISSVAFAPDGKTLAAGGEATVELWDVDTKTKIATFKAGAINDLLSSVAFAPDGKTLAVGVQNGSVELWDVDTKTKIANLEVHRKYGHISVAFAPDGKTLAAGIGDGAATLWDVDTKTKIANLDEPKLEDRSGLFSPPMAFAPDGKTLAVGTRDENRDGAATLWDVDTKTKIATFEATGTVYSLAFAPNGAVLAAEVGATIQLWDMAKRKKIANFAGASGFSVAFSPDGNTLAAGAQNGSVQLWDVSEWTRSRPHRLVKTASEKQQRSQTLAKVSGEGQEELTGTQLDEPLVVSVVDQDGLPLAEVSVTFAVTAGGGTLSATTVTTDANGRAATRLTLGSDPGTHTVEATVAGLEPATFTATAIERMPHSLDTVSGEGQEGPASTQLAEPLVVAVLDQGGSPLAEVDVTFAVTAGEGLLASATDTNPCTIEAATSSATATTDANGRATTRLTLGSDPGTHTVEATVAGLEPETFTATAAEPAIPHSLTKVCGDDQEGTAIVLLDEPLVVVVSDAEDAALAGVVVSFAVTAGGGTLSDTTATTDANGRAATRLTLGIEAGTNTVAATVAGLEPVTFTATAQESPFVSLFDALFGGGKRVALPASPQLAQNAPNPFNSQTILAYFLPAPSPARVEVFALTGQRVVVLQQGPQQAGYHRLHWDGRDAAGRPVASGAYLYRLVTDETVLTRKLILLR